MPDKSETVACTCDDKPESVLNCERHKTCDHIEVQIRQTLAPWRFFHPRSFDQMVQKMRQVMMASMRLLI